VKEGQIMDREETTTAAPALKPIEPEPEPQLVEPEPSDSRPRIADKRWLKPPSAYERKETTVVEGLRYG
jgi:hypothetical protein